LPPGKPFAAHQQEWWLSLDLSSSEKLRVQQDLSLLRSLEELVGAVEAELGRLSTCDPWVKQVPFLVQLPGLGVLSVMSLLGAIGDITRFPSAKKLVGFDCSIDFLAGPTEIVVVSHRGKPLMIAGDLVAQAEWAMEKNKFKVAQRLFEQAVKADPTSERAKSGLALVEDLRSGKKTLAESREHDPELDDVYGKLLAEVYYRLDNAMKAFFRRIKVGEIPGFPRVRPRHNFFTLCYPAMYLVVVGNLLTLPTGGRGKSKRFPNIVARLTEEAPNDFGEVAISRDARGNYYASFTYQEDGQTCEQEEGQAAYIAFDLGIKTLATGVNEQGRVYTVGGIRNDGIAQR